MTRKALDAKAAFAALQKYKATRSESNLEFAYELVDECIEITQRRLFRIKPNDLDDIMQAGRMRLWKALPELAETAQDSSHYIRFCLLIARRAMLTEFKRLKSQRRHEIASVDDLTPEEKLALAADDSETRHAEDRASVTFLATEVYRLTKRKLVAKYADPQMLEASFFLLRTFLSGYKIDAVLLGDMYGSEAAALIKPPFHNETKRLKLLVEVKAIVRKTMLSLRQSS